MSKYAPLGEFLRFQPQDDVPMRFSEIERLLGFDLPASARRHRAWWSNSAGNSTMTRIWLEVGFETAQVDLETERLVFRRVAAHSTPGFSEPEQSVIPGREGAEHPIFGAMRGTVQIMPGVDLTEPADPEWGRIAYGDDDE
jgi:hypothetical protein